MKGTKSSDDERFTERVIEAMTGRGWLTARQITELVVEMPGNDRKANLDEFINQTIEALRRKIRNKVKAEAASRRRRRGRPKKIMVAVPAKMIDEIYARRDSKPYECEIIGARYRVTKVLRNLIKRDLVSQRRVGQSKFMEYCLKKSRKG